MTAPPIEATHTSTLRPARDGRLLAYGVLSAGILAVALIMGEPGLTPLGVPFALAVALGLRRWGPVDVTARVTLVTDQVLEGDPVDGRLEITWSGPFDAHALIHRPRGGKSDSTPDLEERVESTDRLELPFRLTEAQWGRHSIGEVWLRLTLPFGLLSWTGRIMGGPSIRVLPGAERLTRLLSPAHSRAAWGMHRSSRMGDGHEFAELRPYAPGDRVRDLNWAATARHRRAIVNRHHPEVSGDVVIALDADDDGSATSRAVLARAARVAWALASVHMRANDRVGVVGVGRSAQWLPPAGGRLAQYKLMDTLLRIGGEAAERVLVSRHWVDVPSTALIIGISTLQDQESLHTLMAWRAGGRSVAVIAIDSTPVLGPETSRSERLATRLWSLELEHRMAMLRRVGIAAVRAPVDGAMTPVVSALQRARRAPPTRRA